MIDQRKEKIARIFTWTGTILVLIIMVLEVLSLLWIGGGAWYIFYILHGLVKTLGLLICNTLFWTVLILFKKRYVRRKK